MSKLHQIATSYVDGLITALEFRNLLITALTTTTEDDLCTLGYVLDDDSHTPRPAVGGA